MHMHVIISLFTIAKMWENPLSKTKQKDKQIAVHIYIYTYIKWNIFHYKKEYHTGIFYSVDELGNIFS